MSFLLTPDDSPFSSFFTSATQQAPTLPHEQQHTCSSSPHVQQKQQVTCSSLPHNQQHSKQVSTSNPPLQAPQSREDEHHRAFHHHRCCGRRVPALARHLYSRGCFPKAKRHTNSSASAPASRYRCRHSTPTGIELPCSHST
jgi:hypothetical protein